MQGVSLNGIRKTVQKEAVAFDLENRIAAVFFLLFSNEAAPAFRQQRL